MASSFLTWSITSFYHSTLSTKWADITLITKKFSICSSCISTILSSIMITSKWSPASQLKILDNPISNYSATIFSSLLRLKKPVTDSTSFSTIVITTEKWGLLLKCQNFWQFKSTISKDWWIKWKKETRNWWFSWKGASMSQAAGLNLATANQWKLKKAATPQLTKANVLTAVWTAFRDKTCLSILRKIIKESSQRDQFAELLKLKASAAIVSISCDHSL